MIDFKEKQAPARYDVAIVGAGFCGVTLAARLAHDSDLRVALIEGSGKFGLGVAYGTCQREHLLNVPAGRMSARAEEPNHFLDWMHTHRGLVADVLPSRINAHDFVPRLVYGRYLQSQLHSLTSAQKIFKVAQRATDIEPESNGFSVMLGNGARLSARRCVLATGMPRPAQPAVVSPSMARSHRYVADPWGLRSLERLGTLRGVAIIGSGLTAIDVALTIAAQHPDASIVMLSRHGKLPHAHLKAAAGAAPLAHADLKAILTAPTLPAAFAAFRSTVARADAVGQDWHAVMDAVRPHVQTLWKRLTADDRRRFLRHVRSLWEIHRHRGAPQVIARVEQLVSDGKLAVRAGRIVSIDEERGQAHVAYRAHGNDATRGLVADAVINCTGPHSDFRALDDPLWRLLVASGLATPDVHGLGIEVAEDGQLVDQLGHIVFGMYALGFLRRAALFESTAVPELRVQVKDLADTLIAQATSSALAI